MAGHRLGRGRPNRPVIVRNLVAEEPDPPVIGSVPVLVVSPWRPKPRSLRLGTRIVLRTPLVPPAVPGNPTTYVIDGPTEKWTVTMGLKRQSVLSREMVPFDVTAFVDGMPYNPTSTVVELAFLTSSRAEPVSGDWKAGVWDTTVIGTYVAMCLVGPGGTVALAAGRYYCWVRITDSTSSEIVVRQVGMLFID